MSHQRTHHPRLLLDRRNFLKLSGLGLLSITLPNCSPFQSDELQEDSDLFRLALLPDTQVYSQKYPDLFRAQTAWLRDNAAALRIAAVLHEGDITETNAEEQWEVAREALGLLDGKIPLCLALGNHDYPGYGQRRDATLFNRYFPREAIAHEPWFGGTFDEGRENAWYLINFGPCAMLVLCLEFGPRDEVVAWANQVLTEQADHTALIVTHAYMNNDDTRLGAGDQHNPHDYATGGNDGEELWAKLISKHPNIAFVFSGHILGDGLGRLISQGDLGNSVHQILANYQMQHNGGDAYLRLLTIRPHHGSVQVETYSPALDRYKVDSQNEFSLAIESGLFLPG